MGSENDRLALRARLLAPRELVFEEVHLDATSLAADGFLAETEFSAVSIGTELAAYVGDPPLRPGPAYPRLVGYCNLARVSRVGPTCGVRIGDRVITHRSHESAFVGRPSEVLSVVSATVDPCVASLTYLGQIGHGALQRACLRPGETVGVLGLGVIGLATVGIARALEAQVIGLANDSLRMRAAQEQGAIASFASDDPDLAPKIGEATKGRGIDIVVLTANSWRAWRTALEIARPHARIAVIGFPGRSEGPPPFNPLDAALFYDKQLSILSSGPALAGPEGPELALDHLRRDMGWLLSLLAEGQLSWNRLITHRLPWSQLQSLYERAAAHDRSLIGAVLEWSADGA